jgi:hypothetical protein
MKLILVLPWETSGVEPAQDDVWKVVDMPALPPVGTLVWVGEGSFCSAVTHISWWEETPSLFHVELEMHESDIPADVFISCMNEMGWCHEPEDSMFSEALK